MSFARLLSEALAADELPKTGDLLAVGLPFLRQLDDLHQLGLIGQRGGLQGVNYDGVRLALNDPDGRESQTNPVVDQLNPLHQHQGVTVTGRFDHDLAKFTTAAYRSGDVFDPVDAADTKPMRPMFVVGYRAWEQLHDHHDALTDIHLAGLLLVSYAVGLDLTLAPATDELALGHRHLLRMNPTLHPVVANVLSEMVQPDRHARPGTMSEIVARLQHHRELPADLDLSTVYENNGAEGTTNHWRYGVLAALRERVFDTSRRNRALYFKPSSAALSLTEASVPLLLNVDRIEPTQLLTWTGDTITAFRKGTPVDLEQWCRFEEAPHLAPGLDKLIISERKLRAEHGQGRLRLIIAFLRWVDPETDEEIHSPLLTMPADLTRKKGVKPHYLVHVDPEAEVNPVLRYVLNKRFELQLPERIDTDGTSIAEFIAYLETAIQRSDPGITIDVIDQPRISLIRRRAQLRVDAYLRRRAQAQASSGRWRRNDYSYDSEDWRPLGQALYRRFVEPGELALRALAGANPTNKPQASLTGDDAPPHPGERERELFALQRSDISRQRWEVDLCAITLASLGSRRSTLARDYDELLERAAMGTAATETATAESSDDRPAPFDAMFSPAYRKQGMAPVPPISLDQMLVLPADSTQAQAVRHSLEGESFIVQGPPGTGKSQTITNLIAALVAEGKRVLFVCEKRAALDVVAHRLEQVGLGPLVATIHDAELDRKPFIGELAATYDDWLSADPSDHEQQRANLLDQATASLTPLAATFADLHVVRHGEHSVAQLIERLVVLRANDVGSAHDVVHGVDASAWLIARPDLEATQAALASAGLASNLGQHFVLRATPAFAGTGNPLVRIPELGNAIRTAVDSLEQSLPAGLDLASVRLDDLEMLLHTGDLLDRLVATNSTGLIDPAGPLHAELRSGNERLQLLVQEAEALNATPGRWHQILSAQDIRTGLALANEAEGSFFSFLNGRWRTLQALIRSSYRFDQHTVQPTIAAVLAELEQWHNAQQAIADHRQRLTARFGTDDTAQLLKMVGQASNNVVVSHVLRAQSPTDLAALRQASTRLSQLGPHLLFAEQSSIGDLRAVAVGLGTMSVAHERALLAWAQLANAPMTVLHAALSSPVVDPASNHLDLTERAILEQALATLRAEGRLGEMTGAQLDDTVSRILHSYQSLLATNATVVLGRTRHRFAEHVAFSEASMAGRSDDDKDYKRSYTAGRRLLEREFKKKMRFRPIRELASGDSGLVVRDLKPVWLMSPLSVSTTLPLDEDQFDVVVFDEASQIPVEDAVPTLYRARQAIVVGDRMQLPPTRFFSSNADADEDELLLDDDGQGLSISLDADSFLTQADLSFNSMMLSWHYRSRSENLISFSNNAFYGGRLATVPDREFAASTQPGLVASTPEEARLNLVAALERPISFHHLEHGVYADRRNEAEADYVAELVRSLLRGGSGLTIGIAAFSEAQQTAIEESLDELAIVDASFAIALEEETQRIDKGEFVGLFVKNLENVQGDERDIIIMSVCYAPGHDGTMRMNFGPINQAGGERRLNVIFSRSKQHMMIVSTILGSQITNTHNDGAASLARFLSYAEAESRGDHGASAAILSAVRADGRSTEHSGDHSAVAACVAAALRARGWEVDLDVGRSVFTIDAAVRGVDGYRLGVMIDPGSESANATSRLVADAGVLAAFDWPITRVFISEWLNAPERVIDRIDQQLRSNDR